MTEQAAQDSSAEEFASVWERYQAEYDYVAPRRGDIRDGVVISVRSGEILLDIGAKLDAMLGSREVERMGPDELRTSKTV